MTNSRKMRAEDQTLVALFAGLGSVCMARHSASRRTTLDLLGLSKWRQI